MRRWVWLAMAMMLLAGCDQSKDKQVVDATSEATVKVNDRQMTVETEDGRATIDRDSQNIRVENKDGSVITHQGNTTQMKSKDVTVTSTQGSAEGFPLPFLPNSTVEQSQHLNSAADEIFQVSLRVNESADKIASFYRRAFQERHLNIHLAEEHDDAVSKMVVSGESDRNDATALIEQRIDEEESTVQIYWTIKKPRSTASSN